MAFLGSWRSLLVALRAIALLSQLVGSSERIVVTVAYGSRMSGCDVGRGLKRADELWAIPRLYAEGRRKEQRYHTRPWWRRWCIFSGRRSLLLTRSPLTDSANCPRLRKAWPRAEPASVKSLAYTDHMAPRSVGQAKPASGSSTLTVFEPAPDATMAAGPDAA